MHDRNESVCRVIVLGSTGSIGTQTLDVIEHLNTLHARGAWGTRYEVVGLAAGNNVDLLLAQAAKFRVPVEAVASIAPGTVTAGSTLSGSTTTLTGSAVSAEHLVRAIECDLVVAAISGIAGLPATLAAVELGRHVALANKETLVAAGALVIPAARRSGSRLLPIDSEHSGVWQCLASSTTVRGTCPPCTVGEDVARITLTASGGPFRTWSKEQMDRASVEDALKHPTWRMGKKVTIDSATLVNKALEIVEAHWLFGTPGDRLDILIHPQSIVHAMVHFADGSTIAQMGPPDMRTAIQYALTWPARAPARAGGLDSLARLDFEKPDLERFPGLSLAYRALNEGGTSGAVMNAANEAAVGAFLARRIAFPQITELTCRAMDRAIVGDIGELGDVMEADRLARHTVESLI
jgi:1-deoxy-D-xylulose-5-phosphate reductoisomerase